MRRRCKRLTIESQLRGAIERGELSLHYQPQVELKTGRVSGMEALLRWRNAELGDVPPLEFIARGRRVRAHRCDRGLGAAHRLRPGERVAGGWSAGGADGGERLCRAARAGPISSIAWRTPCSSAASSRTCSSSS